jgi:hypothetical protein
MAYNSQSKTTIQNIIDEVRVLGELELVFGSSGYTDQPALGISNDVITAICAAPFPWKWNETALPVFYTNSWQQDYALVNLDGSSVTNVEWLERGVAFNINNSSMPKPWAYVETGRQLPQRTGAYGTGYCRSFTCNTFPNYSLYYGIWGQANTGGKSLGNNPVAGSVYTALLGSNSSQIQNPIMQITDANGNYLVLTGFGIEGTAAPCAELNAVPGTTCFGPGATTIWTVVDPNGTGIRILDIPGPTGPVWQFNLVAQMVKPTYTDIKLPLTPFPDKYKSFFKSGFIAQAYRYSPLKQTQAKFDKEWALWLRALSSLREISDVEQEENRFVPAQSVMGRGQGRSTYVGGRYPFRGPVYPGQ